MDIIEIKDDKSEMLYMLRLLLNKQMITETEYTKAVDKINSTYK